MPKHYKKKRIVMDCPEKVVVLSPEEQRKKEIRERKEAGKAKYLERMANRPTKAETPQPSGVLKENRGPMPKVAGSYKAGETPPPSKDISFPF